jgi:predicted  nucleic acid-binding Zn-ribbon protein
VEADDRAASDLTRIQADLAARDAAVAADALRAEVVTLRDTLVQAEDEAQQRATLVATTQAEIRTLRERLAQAEREAQQRATAAARLEVEIVELQGSLTAARQVGRTAIAALQIGITAPSIPDGPRGWRHTVMRFFGAPGRISNRASSE